MAEYTVRAVVLMTVPAKYSGHLVTRLLGLEQVTQAGALYGEMDIYAMVQAEDMRALRRLIMFTIQGYDEVQSTRTHIMIPGMFWSHEPTLELVDDDLPTPEQTPRRARTRRAPVVPPKSRLRRRQAPS